MFRKLFACCTIPLLLVTVAQAQTAAVSPPPSGFVGPKVQTRVKVPYPEVARLNRIEGVVRIKFHIDEAGHVTSATVSGGTSHSLMLDYVAKEQALREWTFQPATLNGSPVPSTYDQDFDFRLDPAEERAAAVKRLAAPIGTLDPPYPPEALPGKLAGQVTISVHWTTGSHPGLVDNIYLLKTSGSALLDVTALRYAYENWRIDPARVSKEAFTKTVDFQPPK